MSGKMIDSNDSNENEDASEAVEEKAVEEKVDDKTEVTVDRSKLPKHMKQRYWNSMEEMRLVELWRLHFHEVTDLQQNLQVFKDIAAQLRESGYHMFALDIRRKMKAMKNKYIQESRRIKETGQESEWRLYRLMHCMISPKRPNCDILFERKAIAAAIDKNKSESLFQVLATGLPVLETLKRLENGESVNLTQRAKTDICFPIGNKLVAATIINSYKSKARLSFTPRVFRYDFERQAQATNIAHIIKSLSSSEPQDSNNSISSTPSISPELGANSLPTYQQHQPLKPHTKYINGKNILKRKAREADLQQIRSENRLLSEKVLLATRRLKQEEQQLKSYELTMKQVHHFYENILRKLEISHD